MKPENRKSGRSVGAQAASEQQRPAQGSMNPLWKLCKSKVMKTLNLEYVDDLAEEVPTDGHTFLDQSHRGAIPRHVALRAIPM